MRRFPYRYQRTLARPAEVSGVGYVTGAQVRLRFMPAPPHSGVVFVRTDLGVRLPARIDQVTATARRTVLGSPPAHVGLVEHVLSTLAGLHIDNCIVELNASEPPGLDGSSYGFVKSLNEAGAVIQPARHYVWGVDEKIVIEQDGATLAIYPTFRNELKISYFLDYGLGPPIDRQTYTVTLTPERYVQEMASARTFVLLEEVEQLRKQGLGSRTTQADLVVFGPRGPIDNRLRWANEPARHKTLDLIGDLALFGHDIRGHVVACRSGHSLNVELVRKLARKLNQVQATRAAA